MLGLVVTLRATTTALHHSPLNYCVSVVKEKATDAKVVCEYEMYPTKPQTQNFIFDAQIYSFLFQHFAQTVGKQPKILENHAFCDVLCKIVISDIW